MAETSSGVYITRLDGHWIERSCTHETLVASLSGDGDNGFPTLLRNLERPVLHVTNDVWVVHLAANETLGVEDGVLGVGVEGVLGGVTDTI